MSSLGPSKRSGKVATLVEVLSGTVSVIFSTTSGEGVLRLRTLPKDGRAGRGVMISSESTSAAAAAGESSRLMGFEELGVAVEADEDTVDPPSSKLTRAAFCFFEDLTPSWEAEEAVSETSWPAAGEFSRRDEAGECLRADLKGETDLAGG